MGWALITEDGNQLPSEIEGVLHRDIHALARLRTVRVAGITGDKHAWQSVFDLFLGHVIEFVGQPLADLVYYIGDNLTRQGKMELPPVWREAYRRAWTIKFNPPAAL